MKRITEDKSNWHNVLIYGPGGTGKTSISATAPGPVLHLLTEQNGLHHIRDSAKRVGCPMPEVLFIESMDDLRYVATALYSDPKLPFSVGDLGRAIVMPRPKTTVLDQLSDLGRLLMLEHDKKYPSKTGKDGLPVRARNWWNPMEDAFRGIVKTFRDAPCHTIFLAEVNEREASEESDGVKAKPRWMGPRLPMQKLADAVHHSVSVCGRAYKTVQDQKDPLTGNRKIVFGVQINGPEYMMTKPLRPLLDNEVPDFGSWCRRLDGHVEDVIPPQAPDEMREGTAALFGGVEQEAKQEVSNGGV